MNTTHYNSFNYKFIFIIFSILLGISALFISLLYIDHTRPTSFDLNQTELNSDVTFYINDISTEKYLTVNDAWAFLPGETIRTFDTSFVLVNTNTDVAYKLPVTFKENASLNELFESDFDYSKAGFQLKVPAKYFDFSNNSYKVYIYYNNNHNNMLVDTNIIL